MTKNTDNETTQTPKRTRAKKATPTLAADVKRALGTDATEGPLGDIARARRAKEPPVHDDPREELRRLVQEHQALTKKATAFTLAVHDRKNRETGETIKSLVPEDIRVQTDMVVAAMKKRNAELETKMLRQLREIPIYKVFLSKVHGCGTIVSAYLVACIDIRRAEKGSALQRYCGLAIVNGRIDRPVAGQPRTYNQEMRTRLFQMFQSVQKLSGRKTKDCPNGMTSKYLDIWRNKKLQYQHSPRYDAAKNTLIPFGGGEPRKGARAVINGAGWRTAARVFIDDLYTVWRALEGLPVWPNYQAAKLGYAHGARPVENRPYMLTLEEALAEVGDVGSRPSALPLPETDPEDGSEEIEDEMLDAAE